MNIDQNILDLFWNLCEKDTSVRLNACADIFRTLKKKQEEVENENVLSKDLEYSVERLIKGLASPRDAARLGYTLLLTEILKKFDDVQIEEILELMKKHLVNSDKQDKRNPIFGQLFAYTALVRSNRLPNHTYLSYVIISLYDLCHGKSYIINAAYEVFIELFSQLSSENFKKDVWPHLKKKLPDDWNNCSADSLWLLLLCIRMFPDSVKAAYLRNHWGAEDIFASDNFEHMKRIIKQTTSSLPTLHPLCSEFVALAKERKDFNELWNTVIDDTLLVLDQKEKTFVGYEMIKLALRDSPSKKIVKIVLSSKFREVFLKSFMNNKNPMNPAACQLVNFFSSLVKRSAIPDLQIMILKVFLQISDSRMFDQALKKKEVSQLIQNLMPDAVKAFSEILKARVLKNESDGSDQETHNMKIIAIHEIGKLVSHPTMLTDIEWRINIIKFLFLHSFFTIKETTSEILHCEKLCDPLPASIKSVCINSFMKTINSLHMRTENQQSSLNNLLQHLQALTDYADQLMAATENVELSFPVEKIEASWNQIKSIVRKLKKHGAENNENNAFQALFLHLSFLIFQDPEDISKVLEELYICCKTSLKEHKQETETSEDSEEPHWTGVVVEILLSFLSKPSKNLRKLVAHVFPLFCPFIEESSLQLILDVINSQEESDVLMNESDGEDDNQDAEFESGSSSGNESDKEQDDEPVDDEFRKKIQTALGPAAEESDAESVVLSDSEMFKRDKMLSEAFKSMKRTGHTKLTEEAEALLNFKLKCLDLIMLYLKSEPPMHMVLICIEPVVAAFEYGHQNKRRRPLLQKAVSTLEIITRMRKFKHHNDVHKSELKRLLELLIPKCHKETNMPVAQKLYSLCLFIVLCSRKIEGASEKETTKTPFYMKLYLTALDKFATGASSNMLPQFFTDLMMACPEMSIYFLEPCISYAFNNKVRLFKRTQCLGLLSEALKFSKGQKDITDEQWLKFGNSILPPAIECLKAALQSPLIKPALFMELLNVVFTSHVIVKEKTSQCLLKEYADALPVEIWRNKNLKKLSKRGKVLKNKIIICLGIDINEIKIPENTEGAVGNKSKKKKRRMMEESENQDNLIKENLVNELKNKLNPEKQNSILSDLAVDHKSDNHLGERENETSMQTKKSKKKKRSECDNELSEEPKKKKLQSKNMKFPENVSVNNSSEDHSVDDKNKLSQEPKKKKLKTKKCKQSIIVVE